MTSLSHAGLFGSLSKSGTTASQFLKIPVGARAIGMGGGDCEFMVDIIETGRVDVVLNFMHYDLTVQDIRGRLLPVAKKQDVGVILGGPFRQGALAVKQVDRIAEMKKTGKYSGGFNEDVVRRIDAIYALSDETGMDLAEMGIRHLLADPNISTVIPGPRTVGELKSNIASALKSPLPEDLVGKINEIGRS